MAIVRWMAVAVAAVAAMTSLTACGGDEETPMQATLTNDGCTYRGDTKAEAGRFTIEVKNETPQGANFALLRLADGYTASTIKPILAKETAWVHSLSNSELRRMQRGQRLLQHPHPDLPQIFDFQHGGSFTEVGVGDSSQLPGVGAPAGNYALICRTFEYVGPLLPDIWQEQYVASPIEVTGALPGVSTAK
jgi:hypothetical protein